ncbi:TRAP transporter large permease [Chelatococcus sp. GCM10030263]|uniref:TRAP transporter large permease n=1 Tax=Chelatococcus sp. GCM10030263 TaxID=3273387 RepID=UPI00361FD4B4
MSIFIADGLLLAFLIALGVPISLSFAGAVIFLVLVGDFGDPSFLIGAGYTQIASSAILAVPLYILAGNIMSRGGMAACLVSAAERLVGKTRSGLGLITVVVTAVFGAISGSAVSAVAAVGSIMIPRMVEAGYSRGYAASLVSAASVLALLIPPTPLMIIYGWATGAPIIACFLAGVVPACLLIGIFIVINVVYSRRRSVVVLPSEQRSARLPLQTAGTLAVPFIILGLIYGGVTTSTEAAAVAVIYAIPITLLLFRSLGYRDIFSLTWQSAQMTGIILIMVFFAAMLSRLWIMENIPQEILRGLMAISTNPIVILLMVNFFLFLIGIFMDDVSGILLSAPLLAPVVSTVGVDPIQFAAIVGTNLGMGVLTPPTAPILYFGAMIGKTAIEPMVKPTLVFILCGYLPVILLTTFMPELSKALPRLVLGTP